MHSVILRSERNSCDRPSYNKIVLMVIIVLSYTMGFLFCSFSSCPLIQGLFLCYSLFTFNFYSLGSAWFSSVMSHDSSIGNWLIFFCLNIPLFIGNSDKVPPFLVHLRVSKKCCTCTWPNLMRLLLHRPN